jgi:N-acetylglucosaminyldiphosphoundecaprenol N-acetyl-beta-D-mannosaminyltransferase
VIRDRKKVLSLLFDTGKFDEFLLEILRLAKARKSSYVCVANVHMTIEAWDDAHFAAIVNHADLVTPDGMPIVKAIQKIYCQKQDRVAGMDLFPELLRLSEKEKIVTYFYGGTEDTLIKTGEFVKNHYPELTVAGLHSPPFRKLTTSENVEIVNQINDSGAQLVFVALGCPKQERWMAENKGKIQACMIGLGGALPVLIGAQKRAPKWMRSLSLEWLYRLLQEPKRLFKRYFYTNSKYLFLILFRGFRKGSEKRNT